MLLQEMTTEELRRAEDRQEAVREGPEERRKAVLQNLADLAGVDVADLDEDVVAQLGTGADLAQIEQAARRETRIRELEKKKASGAALTAAEAEELTPEDVIQRLFEVVEVP